MDGEAQGRGYGQQALGFLPAERPAHPEDPGCPCVYLEMTRENWEAREISAKNPETLDKQRFFC